MSILFTHRSEELAPERQQQWMRDTLARSAVSGPTLRTLPIGLPACDRRSVPGGGHIDSIEVGREAAPRVANQSARCAFFPA